MFKKIITYSEPVKAMAEKALKKVAKAKGGTANYAAVHGSDEHPSIHIYPNTACHAGLSHGRGKPNGVKLIVTAIWPNTEQAEETSHDMGDQYAATTTSDGYLALARQYYSWLIKDSIWSEVFIGDDVEEVLEKRGFICRTDVPDNLLFSAACATRSVWEYSTNIKIWKLLVDGGVDPAFAYLMCKKINKKVKYYHNILGNNGHWPLPVTDFYKGKVKGFMNNRHLPLYKDRDTYYESNTYFDADAAWRSDKGKLGTLESLIESTLYPYSLEGGSKEIPFVGLTNVVYRSLWNGKFTGGQFTKEALIEFVKTLEEKVA